MPLKNKKKILFQDDEDEKDAQDEQDDTNYDIIYSEVNKEGASI